MLGMIKNQALTFTGFGLMWYGLSVEPGPSLDGSLLLKAMFFIDQLVNLLSSKFERSLWACYFLVFCLFVSLSVFFICSFVCFPALKHLIGGENSLADVNFQLKSPFRLKAFDTIERNWSSSQSRRETIS